MPYASAVPPTVTAIDSEPIGVETRDGTPSQITVGFSITRDFPEVELDNITWTYIAQGQGQDQNVDVLTLASNNSRYELSDDRRTLTIIDVSFSDAGTFTLVATNEAGIGSTSLELIVHGKLRCRRN